MKAMHQCYLGFGLHDGIGGDIMIYDETHSTPDTIQEAKRIYPRLEYDDPTSGKNFGNNLILVHRMRGTILVKTKLICYNILIYFECP